MYTTCNGGKGYLSMLARSDVMLEGVKRLPDGAVALSSWPCVKIYRELYKRDCVGDSIDSRKVVGASVKSFLTRQYAPGHLA